MTATTEATLDFDATITPQLVWKLAPEQTFVTSWTKDEERQEFRVGARVPLAHLRFSDAVHPYLDIVLLAEIVNQAGVIVATELLDVPLDSTFLLRRFRVELDPLESCRVGRDATRLILTTDRDTTFFKVRRTGRPPTGSMICRMELDGCECGEIEVQGVWVTDEMYQAFRRAGGGADGTPEAAEAVRPEPELETGRALPRNRAITRLQPAGEPHVWQTTVLADREDPTFNERELDHVPGLLLFEAAKQATVAAICRERLVPASRVVVGRASFTFTRFAELSVPVVCRLDLSGGIDTIAAEFTQLGKALSRAKLGATIIEE